MTRTDRGRLVRLLGLVALALCLQGCATAMTASFVTSGTGPENEFAGRDSLQELIGVRLSRTAVDSGDLDRYLFRGARRGCKDSTPVLLVLPENLGPEYTPYFTDADTSLLGKEGEDTLHLFFETPIAAGGALESRHVRRSGGPSSVSLADFGSGPVLMWKADPEDSVLRLARVDYELRYGCRSKARKHAKKLLLVPAFALDAVLGVYEYVGGLVGAFAYGLVE